MKTYLLIAIFALLATSCTAKGGRETQSTKPSPSPAVSKAVEITDATYEEAVRSQKVVLLMFWAPWSAPDRELMPVIDALSAEYRDRVKIGKVDVDESPDLAKKFLIKGIPTLVVLKDGTEQDRMVGLVPRKKITALLDKHLATE